VGNYTFEYLTGGIICVEVEAEWVEILDAFDYEEKNQNRTETRRHVYISTLSPSDERLAAHAPNPAQMVCAMESYKEIMDKLDTLTSRQLEVLRMRLDGMSGRAIAKVDEIQVRAVQKTITQIQKKFS
jgi:DNA-binding NarL/FixJ family response regulator